MNLVSPDYLAGFFDGEGSAQISHTGYNKSGEFYTSYTFKVSLANTNERALRVIQDTFGGRLDMVSKQRARFKAGYRLSWWGPEAYTILRLMYPCLIIKREQADLAFAFREAHAKMKRNHQRPGKQRTEAEARLLNDFRLQMKALNKRGVDAVVVEGHA